MKSKVTEIADDSGGEPVEHPGWYLRRLMAEKGLTHLQVGNQIGRSQHLISKIVCGHVAITAATAVGFEKVFDLTAERWLEMQAAHEIDKVRRFTSPGGW